MPAIKPVGANPFREAAKQLVEQGVCVPAAAARA
jgi:hypothetical protein